jgi:hypothetical protein
LVLGNAFENSIFPASGRIFGHENPINIHENYGNPYKIKQPIASFQLTEKRSPGILVCNIEKDISESRKYIKSSLTNTHPLKYHMQVLPFKDGILLDTRIRYIPMKLAKI